MAGKPDEKAMYLKEWDRVRAVTLKVARALPPEKYDFKPVPEVWTFGEQLRHILTVEETFLAGITKGDWNFERGYAAAEYNAPASIEALARKIHTASKRLIGKMTPRDLHREIATPWKMKLPAIGLLWFLRDHEIHHRGQLYVSLRLNGIVPPFFVG